MNHRVMLCEATAQDIDFIADIKMDASLWVYEPETEIPSDRASLLKIIAERIHSDWYKCYIIKLNDKENTAIGELHLHWYVKERESWEIGYCIFPEYRNQGYCAEAVQIGLAYAFEKWKAHKVVAMCNERNTASYHIMEKSGMIREAVFREELRWRGEWVNQYFYCILDHEYQKRNFDTTSFSYAAP